MSNKKTSIKTGKQTQEQSNFEFVFGRQNYLLMLVGIAVIVLGFALMYGKEDIYDFRKITLAPIVVLIGFVIEVFAIMHKPNKAQ
ncbi:MAG: DUF3098 domain-containing protein [Bacteroidia bacterium]